MKFASRFFYETAVRAIAFALIAVSLLFGSPAFAGNTTFYTSPNGDQVFPFSPPNKATGAPGTIDNMVVTPPAGLPTIASGACGATTNGAVLAGSTNNSGRITIGAATTTSCAVAFSSPTFFAAAPKSCTITPMNAAAAASGTAGGFVTGPTQTGFTIGGLALASTNWSYQCE